MTRMTEMEVSPQEEMANPQSMKMFVVENMGFLKISCLFVLCVECKRHNLSVRRISRLPGVRYSGRHRERLGASGLGSPELSFQVRRSNVCTTCTPAHMDASITRTGRNGQMCVEDGQGRRLRVFVVWM